MDQLLWYLEQPQVVIPLLIWSGLWKGVALWQAARKEYLVWFVVFLLVNTLGLLEIAYIFKLNKWDLGSEKLLSEIKKRWPKT